jgi:CubicO group peptidase (beta-lactamase class C family)
MSPATHRVIAIVVAVLLSWPWLGAAAANPDQAYARANAQARQLIQKTMQDRRIPGLQIAVVKDGKVVLSESYGLANVENRLPASRTTLFPINSATKSFTGVAMMQLAEAGLVDLDAPVSRYLDDLPEAWRAVRVRQLLAHTSGLPDILDEQGLLGGGTESNAWGLVKKLPMQAAIGERFEYNQVNYALLARIIAKQSKMPYERYLAQGQFAVVGMPSTRFGDSYDLVPGAATIYSYFPRKTDDPGSAERLSHWFYDMTPSLWAGGGILTTADEVARWMVALSDGRLIDAASLRGMWTPEKLNDGSDGSWSAGWPVLGTAANPQRAGIGGARAAFIVYPNEKLAVIVLTNLVGANPERFIPQIAALYQPAQRAAAR